MRQQLLCLVRLAVGLHVHTSTSIKYSNRRRVVTTATLMAQIAEGKPLNTADQSAIWRVLDAVHAALLRPVCCCMDRRMVSYIPWHGKFGPLASRHTWPDSHPSPLPRTAAPLSLHAPLSSGCLSGPCAQPSALCALSPGPAVCVHVR